MGVAVLFAGSVPAGGALSQWLRNAGRMNNAGRQGIGHVVKN
jgi:hypothetical protein